MKKMTPGEMGTATDSKHILDYEGNQAQEKLQSEFTPVF